VAARLAEARGTTPEAIVRRTSDNAARLFAHAAPWPQHAA